MVVLTVSKAYVLHKNKLLLTGARKKGQIWYLNPMDSGDKPTVNEIEEKNEMTSITKPSYLDMPMVNYISSVYQTKILKDAIQFHHSAFNNCAKSMLLTADRRGTLPLWPLSTRARISKYVSETQATHMGHIQRIRKNLRSTRREIPLYLKNFETEGINIEQEKKCGEVYLMVLEIRIMNGTMYTYLNGSFPVTSAWGNKLLYIAYSYYANGILCGPMKSKNDSDMSRVFKTVYNKLEK